MKYFYLAVSSIILAYIGITIFIYFYQRNLLYHPSENNYLNDKITFEYENYNHKTIGTEDLASVSKINGADTPPIGYMAPMNEDQRFGQGALALPVEI